MKEKYYKNFGQIIVEMGSLATKHLDDYPNHVIDEESRFRTTDRRISLYDEESSTISLKGYHPKARRKTAVCNEPQFTRSQKVLMNLRKGLLRYRSKRSEKPIECDSLLTPDEEESEAPSASKYVVLGLEGLLKKTEFKRGELQRMYRSFKTECPSGIIDLETFMSIISWLFPDGDPSLYATRLFQTFDKNSNNSITFEELVIGLSNCLHGSIEDKLRWSFQLYDLDGNGYIGKEELSTTVYGLYGLNHQLDLTEAEINKHVDELFAAFDLNDDGLITEEEFITSCKENVRIQASLNSSKQPSIEVYDP